MTIQELIDAAAPGAIITVPPGIYDVDGVKAPIRLKSGVTLDLTDVTLNILPTTLTEQMWFGIVIGACEDVIIRSGQIKGNRSLHPSNRDPMIGGLGQGIVIGYNSRNVKIQGTSISSCFGDGVLIVGGHNVELDNVVCSTNRRQGLSASDVDGLWVHDCKFYAQGGAAPGAGIDLEPDVTVQNIRGIKIERCAFAGNVGAGVLLACSPAQRSNINIAADNTFIGQPIDGTDGVVPFWAKWIHQICGGWYGYPRELHIQ